MICVLVIVVYLGSILISFVSNGLPIELHNSIFHVSLSTKLINEQQSLEPFISIKPLKYLIVF